MDRYTNTHTHTYTQLLPSHKKTQPVLLLFPQILMYLISKLDTSSYFLFEKPKKLDTLVGLQHFLQFVHVLLGIRFGQHRKSLFITIKYILVNFSTHPLTFRYLPTYFQINEFQSKTAGLLSLGFLFCVDPIIPDKQP